MAKKLKKVRLNTDLDDLGSVGTTGNVGYDEVTGAAYDYTFVPAGDMGDDDPQQAEDVTYTMGDIQVMNNDAGAEDEDFKKASEILAKDSAEDEDETSDWVEEDFNYKDEDPFLDMEKDYDMDNPYQDD